MKAHLKRRFIRLLIFIATDSTLKNLTGLKPNESLILYSANNFVVSNNLISFAISSARLCNTNADEVKRFDISFVGLKDGTHQYRYDIDETFFDLFDYSDLGEAKIQVVCDFKKYDYDGASIQYSREYGFTL